jgi:hypothetical protein
MTLLVLDEIDVALELNPKSPSKEFLKQETRPALRKLGFFSTVLCESKEGCEYE